ncbi:substrate-binding periplasmic protein [Shewanella gaetbuli]
MSSKPITFTTSNSIEPYFFVDQQGGIQYELLDEALTMSQLTLAGVTFATNLRALKMVRDKDIDCIINSPANTEDLFHTQSLIEYQNSVFFLTEHQLDINELDDLSRYPLVGFQNANQFLGQAFYKLSQLHPDYRELSSQKSQVLMLMNKHTEVIILEQRIFAYYLQAIMPTLKSVPKVTQVNLFPPAPRYIACHNEQTAKLVDDAITQFKQSSQYQDIINKLKPLTQNN